MDNLEQRKCTQHDLEFLAIKISQENKEDIKYLCSQCLVELTNSKELILINQAKIEIENKKKQISKNKEEQHKQKINIINNLNQGLLELRGPLDSIFTKIIEELEQLKSQTEKQLQQGDIITPENLVTDIGLLSEEINIQSNLQTADDEISLIKSLLNYSKYFELANLSQKIREILSKYYDLSTLQNEISNNNMSDQQLLKTQQTPFLKFLCSNHDQYIFMLQLNESDKAYKFSCAQQLRKIHNAQLITKQYENYQQQSQIALQCFQQQREQHTRQIVKLCTEICEKFNQTINLLIQQLEDNLKSFEKNIDTNQQFKNLNIFQQEQDQLQQLLEPLFQGQCPNHFNKIIEKQLEQDKQLYIQFDQNMDDLIKFQMNNINQITLEQLEHQFVLKKIEIYCDKQVSNETIEKEIQKSENSKDQEINLLENQINHFINKNFKLNLLNQQFQQTSQNRDQIQNEQAQIVQNLTNVESELKEQLKSCQQELQKLHLEKKIINLQKLNHKLNSITFKKQILKEIQIQTDVTIQDFEKVELLNKEIQLELKQNQEKMPQYLDQINVLKTEINSLKQKHLFTLFSKSYQPQFNASYKLAAYHVANSKLIQSPQGGFGIAIMQPSLPKNQLTIFAFKINKYDCWLGVGITHLQTAQSFNYDMNANYTQQNHNTYLACAGGYRISSHQGYNGQTKFIYQQGSIIICCYDPLTFKLSLLHLNDGKTYELELANNINLEMSPCVMLYGNSEVEVL